MNVAVLSYIVQTLMYAAIIAFGVTTLLLNEKNLNANKQDKWFAITFIALGAIGFVLSIIRFVIR